MKNIFDYATKELSQDAFLMWLFENYDCENSSVRFFAYKILNIFNNLNMNVGDIDELKTYRQYPCSGKIKGKIDVIIQFKYAGDIYLTVIEDKTYSNTHDNQLIKYDITLNNPETLEYFNVGVDKISKIFYKTDIIDPFDVKACSEADGWTTYFLDDISKMLDMILAEMGKSSTGDEILDDYINHIHNLVERTTEISTKPMSEWSRLDFRTFFYKKVLENNPDPRISQEIIYDVKYYAYCSFMIFYYIPGTLDKITAEVIFREYSAAAHIMCRVSNFPSKSDMFNDADEKHSKPEIEQLVQDTFISDVKRFKKAPNTNAKKYKTFANESKAMAKRIKYNNGPDEVASAIKEMLSAFLDRCEKIKI